MVARPVILSVKTTLLEPSDPYGSATEIDWMSSAGLPTAAPSPVASVTTRMPGRAQELPTGTDVTSLLPQEAPKPFCAVTL